MNHGRISTLFNIWRPEQNEGYLSKNKQPNVIYHVLFQQNLTTLISVSFMMCYYIRQSEAQILCYILNYERDL